jgi:hypothetical protein
LRPAHEIKCGGWSTTHRVNIRERIGGGNLPVSEGIVHDRREKIDRINDREVVAQTEHPGVVTGGYADEQVGMSPEIELGERCFKVRRTQLAGSTGGFTSGGQANQLAPARIGILNVRHLRLAV